ncbi:MAG: hypothetical protein H6730_06845 [Deltaproteobacteria bacterium]|nr:hypothetical protein [Deltaproteobacteria bacterium]
MIDQLVSRNRVRALTTVLQLLTLANRHQAKENIEQFEEAPVNEFDDEQLRGLLLEVHSALLQHPIAARSAWQLLVAEGRRAIKTDDGARLGNQLAASSLVRRGALLWNTLTMGLLDDLEPTSLPSSYIDVLERVALRGDLETFLDGLGDQRGS